MAAARIRRMREGRSSEKKLKATQNATDRQTAQSQRAAPPRNIMGGVSEEKKKRGGIKVNKEAHLTGKKKIKGRGRFCLSRGGAQK